MLQGKDIKKIQELKADFTPRGFLLMIFLAGAVTGFGSGSVNIHSSRFTVLPYTAGAVSILTRRRKKVLLFINQ